MASQRAEPPNHEHHLRQTSLIFTYSSDGRITEGLSLPPSVQKTPLSKPPNHQRTLPQTDEKYRRVSSSSSSSSSSSIRGEASHSTHNTFTIATDHHFCTPIRRSSVAKLNFSQENLFPSTPLSQTKCPIPLSSKKIKQKAAMKLKEMESERIEASRNEQDQSEISLEAQEKAYLAWLNHVILEPMHARKCGMPNTLSLPSMQGKNCGVTDTSLEPIKGKNCGVTDTMLQPKRAHSRGMIGTLAEPLQVRNCGTNTNIEPILTGNCGINEAILEPSRMKKPGMFDTLPGPMEVKKFGMNDTDLETSCMLSSDHASSIVSSSVHDHSGTTHLSIKAEKFMLLDSPSGSQFLMSDRRNISSKRKLMKENLPLDASLLPICSISVLRSRLEPLLNVKSREDVIHTMINLAKHIDEGRLKMKDGYTMLTDVALKEKFIQAMLSYNTPWLKMGLHVVLGHGALLVPDKLECPFDCTTQLNAEEENETQNTVLRWIIEKHFMSHPGLAKHHATNKKIEGLYKQGYNEALARVILKRILLFVLTLDKAKCERTLPLACGIDGIDGGSPRLFHINRNVKSSRQALQEFLLNSMHGEGDVVGHLGVLRYHVTHVQAGLADYNFELNNLIEDLQDGVRLCRLVQILLGDTSILMKVKLPSDRPRRHIHNCRLALERLQSAGVPLLDSCGCLITSDDLTGGHQEKVVSLLWNIMFHLQIPMLVNVKRLREEIHHIQPSTLASSKGDFLSLINLLLLWAQVISKKSGFPVKDFTSSFADGQALCYLINYYFPALLPRTAIKIPRSSSFLQNTPETTQFQSNTKETFLFTPENNICAAQNLDLFLFAIRKLGHIPEVLQSTYFMDGNPFVCEQSVIIALTFLYHRLIEVRPKINEKNCALGWNADLEVSKLKCEVLMESQLNDSEEECKHRPAINVQSSFGAMAMLESEQELKGITTTNIQGCKFQQKAVVRREFDAVVVIQSHVKRWIKRKSFPIEESLQEIQIRSAVLIQAYIRGWLVRCQLSLLKRHVFWIQSFWRAQCSRQMFLNQRRACLIIQNRWRAKMKQSQLNFAARKIQAFWRMSVLRKIYLEQRTASVLIQSFFRSIKQREKYLIFKENVVRIQALTRGKYVRMRYLKYRNAVVIVQRCWKRTVTIRKQKEEAVTKIQCVWRRFSTRRNFLIKREAAIVIQKCTRVHLEMNKYRSYRHSLVKVQAMVRCRYERMRYCKLLESVKTIQCSWRRFNAKRIEERKYATKQRAAVRIQAFWRGRLVRESFLRLQTCTIYLQNRLRSSICRMRYKKLKESVVRVQAFWRAQLARQSFLKLRASTVNIQNSLRSYICRMQYKRLREVVIRIQAFVRRKQEREKYQELRKYTVKIQALFRRRIQQRRYELLREAIIRVQALFRCKRERREFVLYRDSAIVIQRCVREYIFQRNLMNLRQKLAAKKIQNAWRFGKLVRAATIIQAYYRGWIQRQLYLIHIQKEISGSSEEPITLSAHIMMTKNVESDSGVCELSHLQVLSCQNDAAITIQRHFRGWRSCKLCNKRKMNIIVIQALWRGILVRQRSNHLKGELSALRQRMQNTAANVDQKMRLEYRITEALAALLSQKTVSGILHTCATIDLATQHSKLCCERLLEAGAIPKLLQLIQTTNRSPPHEEILKHSLSILGNLARYPEFAALVANPPSSILIIAEQILRNNEEVQSKVIKLLLLVCKVPCGLDAVRKKPVVVKRLYNLSHMLEKKVEVEARSLARLPQNAPLYVRRAGERKVTEAVAHHHSLVLLLQSATGEDLQNKLKAMKRLSHIHMVASPRLSMMSTAPRLSISTAPRLSMSTAPRLSMMSRDPFRDCSNH